MNRNLTRIGRMTEVKNDSFVPGSPGSRIRVMEIDSEQPGIGFLMMSKKVQTPS